VLSWCDCPDDNQLPATTRARQCEDTRRLIGIVSAGAIGVLMIWRFCPKQQPDPGNISGSVAVPEEAVVANAVLAFWEHVDQEPSDEFGRSQRHGGVAARAFKAVIFDTKGDVIGIGSDQTTVGDRDPMGIAGQICQHGFRSGEGFFGVDDPVYFAQWGEERCKIGCIGKVRMTAKELQLPGFV